MSKYAAAMSEALDWASKNEPAVRSAIATNLKIPEAAAAGIQLPQFTSTLNVDNVKKLGALAVTYKYIDAEPDWNKLIQPKK